MSKLEHEIEAFFNQYEGTNDLSRRLDEFIKNRQAMAKPVQMEKIFEQLKNVLKKGFEKILALKCSDKQESRRVSVIGNVLEIVAAISDVSEDGKSAVVDFVLPCLHLLADKQKHLTVRLELSWYKLKTEDIFSLQANRFLNGVIESFLRLNRDLDSPPFVLSFDDLITNAGDLELQLCMTELICRMLPCEMRQLYAQVWFQQNPECRDDFLSIRDVEFETDCRKFVNNLNERQLEKRSVYSVLCKEVYLGLQKVDCPSDDGDNGMFWTDFNLGSKSISFFAINEENDVWETVTIREGAVLQTQILDKKQSHEALLLVQLDKPACTLLSSLDQSDEKYVKFIYDEKNSPLTAASLLFPKDFASDTPASPDVIASTPKASVTSNAVRVSSRAKGLSKTVSLSTPRRRKGKGESSDESSKSNDPASSKDKQIKNPIPNKKETSSSDGKGDNTQIKNPTVPDKKKKQRSSRLSGKAQLTSEVSDSDGSVSKGNKGTNRKPEKVKESSMPVDQVVSGDEKSRVRTRSSRSNDAGKHNDQNQTEIEQRGKGGQGNGMDNTDEVKKGRVNRSMDESGLGKSIDSGLGKSMDNQDLTMEDSKDIEGHSGCLQDMSQDEPTVIHATQTLSQEGVDDDTHLDDEEFSKDQDEDPLSVIAKKSEVHDGAKDVKKADVDRDSSSGPFKKASASEKTISKRKKSEVEQAEGESSTAFIKKTTKPVKAKAATKTRQIRTRAAAKKNASIGASVSTSESEITDKTQTSKARAKSAEPGSKGSKAITRFRSVSDIDKRNKLGSGYNTEDWMMGYSDLERRTEKKKALENASNVSKSRLSLISTVYRQNYKTDYKYNYKRKKSSDPYTFTCSPPAKRSPQGKKLLRPALRTYQRKKQAELQQKREGKGIKTDEPMSYKAYKKMKENETSFSDIALEVQRKHRERELRKHHSESDVLNRTRDSEPDEHSTTEILNDWKEKSETRRNPEQGAFKDVEENEQNKENEKDAEGTTPVGVEREALDPPADDIDSSQFNFDDQQAPADVTAEPDQESFDGDSLPNLFKEFLGDKPTGNEENVDKHTEDQVEKDGARRTKDQEIINNKRDKKAMENHEDEDKESPRKSVRGTKPRTNANSENPARRSTRDTSTDRPRGIQNILDEESKMLLNHVFGRDDEDGDLEMGAKENPRNKKQVDASGAQRGTKPRVNSIQENPAKKSARDTSTDRARGKQKSTDEESIELGDVFDDGNADSLLGIPVEPKQTKRNTAQRTRSASDSNARHPAKKQEAGRRDILKEDDVYADETGDELEESSKEERSPRPTKKRIPHDRKSVKEHDDGEGDLSSGTALILDDFKKNFERIIEDSDDCVDLPTNANKSSTSRKQSETISKNKKTVKSVNKRRESLLKEEHLYHPHEPLKFEISTPKANTSRATDSGFFDKTSSSSSKKRTYDKRGQTPGSAKSDVQDETPGSKVLRKSRRFGRLDVQSTGSRTPHRGYHSNDDKHTPRIQEEHESAEEDCNFFSHSQPASSNQGSRKRKGSRDTDTGFKSESKVQKRKKGSAKDGDFAYPYNIIEFIEDMDGQDYVNDSFKTPVDSQSMPIQPRKLFRSSDQSAAKKRRKEISGESRADDDDDDDDDDDEDIEDEFDDEVSIGEEMQTSFVNLGKEVKKTIKQRQDYVSQIASATMKLITAKSEEMWSKQSSRRNTLMNEFTSCVNKYVEDHQQIAGKRQQIEDDMISQVKNHLEALAKQRKEQEKCLRGIIKTQKAFTETFKSIEDAEQSQRMDFLDSLRKELKRYRDQAAQEVQKQEFENIKRRIQAMLGMSL